MVREIKLGQIYVLKNNFNFESKFVLPMSISEKLPIHLVELSFIDIETGNILKRAKYPLKRFIKNSLTLDEWNKNKESIYDKLEKKLTN